MSDFASPATSRINPDRIRTTLVRWAADPRLGALTASLGNILLVLDMDGRQILHASTAAARLVGVLADSKGLVRDSVRLAAQVGRIGPDSARPKLARLRFDPRGLAPPATCFVTRAELDGGGSVLLIAPLEVPRGLRLPPVAETGAAADGLEEPLEQVVPAVSAVPALRRLTWRSDADGILVQADGEVPDVVEALLGRRWQDLGASALTEGSKPAFTALASHETFRGLGVILDLPRTREEIEIEFSGTPSSRPVQPFAGFTGFGQVRARRARGEGIASRMPSEAAWPRPLPNASRSSRLAVQPEPAIEPKPSPPAAQSALSTHEHDAFRQIARALGARYAGDDFDGGISGRDTLVPGAVTPFPMQSGSTQAGAGRAGFDSALASALDGLPTGIVVHQERRVLFANRWFLDKVDLADAGAVERAPWFGTLVSRAAASPESVDPGLVEITTRSGGSIALFAESSRTEWEGEPATILLARVERVSAPQPPPAPEPPVFVERPNVPAALRAETVVRLGNGVLTLDDEGRVIALNPEAAALFGTDDDAIVGESLAALFEPNGAASVAASLLQARERGAADPCDIESKGGQSALPLRLRIARLLSTGPTAYRVTLEDVRTLTRSADEKAERHRRGEGAALRRIAYFASAGEHIRQPINGILGVADAVLAEQFGPLGSERYREYLQDIVAHGEDALGLIDGLIDLARVEAGRADLAMTDVRLNEVVSGCIARIEAQAARDQILVRTSLSPDLETVRADERALRQATMNVIANAIRLTDPGGQVIVSTTIADRGEVALRVRDTGAGMTEREIEDALDPFRHVAGSEPRHRELGSGIGLTVSKALVEANHGRFRLTSRKNEGTLIEMVFPARQALSA